MVGVGGSFSHIDWVGVVVGGVKTSFCTSLIPIVLRLKILSLNRLKTDAKTIDTHSQLSRLI